jgi:hypothetical protein
MFGGGLGVGTFGTGGLGLALEKGKSIKWGNG